MSKSILSNVITFVIACVLSYGIEFQIKQGAIYIPLTLAVKIHRDLHPKWFWLGVILNCCVVVLGFYISIAGFIRAIKKAKDNKHRIPPN